MPPRKARPRARSHTAAAQAAAVRRVREELHKVGLLLAVDRDLPNVVRAVTGRLPVGSWWSDPDSHLIFATLVKLGRDEDILRLRMMDGKWTYVHRRLWPAVLGAAGQRGTWQRQGLSPRARRLLERVMRLGVVDINTPAARGGITLKQAGEAARELERRILVLSYEVHTPQGLHTKRLESWETWRRRVHVRRSTLSGARARARLEAAAEAMASKGRAAGRLPWQGGPAPDRSSRAPRRVKK